MLRRTQPHDGTFPQLHLAVTTGAVPPSLKLVCGITHTSRVLPLRLRRLEGLLDTAGSQKLKIRCTAGVCTGV